MQIFLALFGLVYGRPDEINGQLAGYNYVFGLQLFNPFDTINNVDFGECFRECNVWDQCISMSYLKGEIA